MYALIVSQPPLRNQTIKPDAPQADPTQADSRSPSNSDLLDVYEILLAQQQLIAQLTQCLLAVLQTEVQFRAEFFDEYRKNHQKINATELIQQCSATKRCLRSIDVPDLPAPISCSFPPLVITQISKGLFLVRQPLLSCFLAEA